MGPRLGLILGVLLAAVAGVLFGVRSLAPDPAAVSGQLDPAVVRQLAQEGVHLESRAGQARACELAQRLPDWAHQGPVTACRGVIGETAARAVAGQYRRTVVGALLAVATGPSGPFGLLMRDRLVWALELDRYIGSMYTWDFLHPGCGPGHILLFVDARSGQPVGEVAWGRQADVFNFRCT